VGRIESVVEQLYAITTERRMQHPAALAVSQTASREVFGGRDSRSISSGNGSAKPRRQTRSSSRRRDSPKIRAHRKDPG
jgi:hypothetical protein